MATPKDFTPEQIDALIEAGREPTPNRAPLFHEVVTGTRAERDAIVEEDRAQLESIHARAFSELASAGLSFGALVAYDFQREVKA